jgi:hypothetical protein
MTRRPWIMVSGPYTSGAANELDRTRNLKAMNDAAWQVWQRGYVPVIGVNMALPVIGSAGADHFETVMMPLSLALADRCDGCLRIGGPSVGADAEVEHIRAAGKPIYNSLAELPAGTHFTVHLPASRT